MKKVIGMIAIIVILAIEVSAQMKVERSGHLVIGKESAIPDVVPLTTCAQMGILLLQARPCQ